MAEFGARIRSVLEQKGLSQSQLARLVGVKQQTISYICAPDSPATTSRYTSKIAQALGVNPTWLEYGQGDQHDPMVRIELEGVELQVRRVPLLRTPEQVLEHTGGSGAKGIGMSLMTDANIGKKAFAVEIVGNSMEPVFKPGDRVVVDPQIEPEPGDFVAALVRGAITFRKYRSRGGGLFDLVPLNNDWPVESSDQVDIQVLGVMAEHRSYRHKP